MRPRRDDDGMVLIAVIWLLALLGGLAMAMSLATTSGLFAIDAYSDHPRAQAAVLAGVNRAAQRVLALKDPGVGAVSLTVGTARVSASWTGETARIDINTAPPELLAGLFAGLGADKAAAAGYAETLVALRGPPGAAPPAATPGHPPGYDPNEETPQAIQALSRGASPAPGAPDARKPFLDVVQLQQVAGLPPRLMARAAPFLTTFSGVAQIDARFAAPPIIAALPGMTRERVRTLLDLRRRDPTAADLADTLGEAQSFTTDKPAATTRLQVRAVLADGFTSTAEVVIVHFPDDKLPYRVLSWDDDVDRRGAS